MGKTWDLLSEYYWNLIWWENNSVNMIGIFVEVMENR